MPPNWQPANTTPDDPDQDPESSEDDLDLPALIPDRTYHVLPTMSGPEERAEHAVAEMLRALWLDSDQRGLGGAEFSHPLFSNISNLHQTSEGTILFPQHQEPEGTIPFSHRQEPEGTQNTYTYRIMPFGSSISPVLFQRSID